MKTQSNTYNKDIHLMFLDAVNSLWCEERRLSKLAGVTSDPCMRFHIDFVVLTISRYRADLQRKSDSYGKGDF